VLCIADVRLFAGVLAPFLMAIPHEIFHAL
jgi:hypothetical protein